MDPMATPIDQGPAMTHSPEQINQMMMQSQDMSGFVQAGNQTLPPNGAPNTLETQLMMQQHAAMAAANGGMPPMMPPNGMGGAPIGAKSSMMTSLVGEFRGAIIVFLVVCLINMGVVDNFLGNQIPGFFSGDQISFLGIAAKAALAGVAFYLLNRFFKF